MIRAILDDRKTVAWRVVKSQPICCGRGITFQTHDNDFCLFPENNLLYCRVCGSTPMYGIKGSNVAHYWEPPYRPGDILYVRETWVKTWKNRNEFEYIYKANVHTPDPLPIKWKPSIHMPCEAARLFLRVTDVRVERLQDMTDDDFVCDFGVCREAIQAVGRDALAIPFWDSTIKKSVDRALYGWDANPWV